MDPLAYLILGGLLGMLGQGARAAIGLKGMADDAKSLDLSPKDLFETARLVTSIVIGFLVGMAAALAYAIGHGGIPDLLKDFGSYYHILIGFIAAGYAGTDFLEGFISQYLPSGTTGAAADKLKAKQTAQTAQMTQAVQAALSTALIAAGAKTSMSRKGGVMILGQKNEDVESCTSEWLQNNKGVPAADSRDLTKNISDFHINTNAEMEQFLWGVVQCLKDKGYTYTPKPEQDSPSWNAYITTLRSGTLDKLVTDFVDHI